MSYMTGAAPKAVKKRDLIPDLDNETAKKRFSAAVVEFIGQVVTDDFSSEIKNDSKTVLKGLLEGIEMEGSYWLKPPCYSHDTQNPRLPTCLHGSPWNEEYTQIMMGGTFDNRHITVANEDNYHRSVGPEYWPSVTTTCDKNVKKPCTINTVTISENIYGQLDKLDTGYNPIAASEIKTKMSSR